MTSPNVIKGDNVAKILDQAMDAGAGLLRLVPTWVPRSFLHPGKRIKLHPDDWYAYGAHRGGIDERWFGSSGRDVTGSAKALLSGRFSRRGLLRP